MKAIIKLLALIHTAYENAVTRFAGYMNSKVTTNTSVAQVERATHLGVSVFFFLMLRFAPHFTLNALTIVSVLMFIYAVADSLGTNMTKFIFAPNSTATCQS